MSPITPPRVLPKTPQKPDPVVPGFKRSPDPAPPRLHGAWRAAMDRAAVRPGHQTAVAANRPGIPVGGTVPPMRVAMTRADALGGEAASRADLAPRRPSRPAPSEEPVATPDPDRSFVLPVPTPWTRPEAPVAPIPSPRRPPEPPPAAPRVFLGRGPDGAEARLSITSGPLAGTEIHLRESARQVSASVLTRPDASGQSVTRAMDEVARRLGSKGVGFRAQYGPRR